MNKIYYTKENLTPDIDCSLRPPIILDGSYTSFPDYSEKKRKWQSAPCGCRLPDGRLLCAFSGDNYGGEEEPNNYNIIYISDDDAKSWKPLFIIDHPDSVRLHEPLLWVDADGTLWHFWGQSYNWWDNRGGVWAMKAAISENGDISWNTPKRLCDGVLACTPLSRSDGQVLLPVSIWKSYKNDMHFAPEDRLDPCVYIFDKENETVEFLSSAHIEDTDFDENCICETKDNKLIMIARCLTCIRACTSIDGGKTWSLPYEVRKFPSSRSFLATFPSGNILLVTNDHETKRSNMTAFLSEDGGKSWPHKLLLDGRFPVSYPAGAISKDGFAYISYDYSRYEHEEIYFARFCEEDIKKGRLCSDSSYIRLVCKGEDGKQTEKVYANGTEEGGR